MPPLCRSCATESENDLLEIHESNHSRHFMILTGIKVEPFDGLPQHICFTCAHILEKFLCFRDRAIENHNLFLESLMKKSQNKDELRVEQTIEIIIEVKEEKKSLQPKDIHFVESCNNKDNISNEESQNEEDKQCSDHYYENSNTQVKQEIDDSVQSGNLCSETNNTYQSTLAKECLHEDTRNINKRENTVSMQTKSKSKQPVKSRILVEVDPEKIMTLKLSTEEQKKRHEIEAQCPKFLNMPYRCLKCHKGFNYMRKLQAHEENYHKEDSKFTCGICQRTLVNSASLALHEARHSTLYQCRLCPNRYVEKTQAIEHYATVHEGVQKSIACNTCGMMFRHRSTLNGHMRSRHPTFEHPKCDTCNKTFVSKDSLLDHKLIHTGEKPHRCSCGKRFRVKSELVVHSRSHAASSLTYCAPCDKIFKSRTSYTNHLKFAKSHRDPQAAEHRCEKCSCVFATKWRLRAHADSHSGVHSCGVCQATLKSQAALNRHMRVAHLSVKQPKNYMCHHCGKTFNTGVLLETHIRTHTGEKPFACTVESCEAKFSQKSTLKTHVRLVHLKQKRKIPLNERMVWSK